jgi:hypothetical protein
MLKEAYGKAAVKKTQAYRFQTRFPYGHETAGFFCTKTLLRNHRVLNPQANCTD